MPDLERLRRLALIAALLLISYSAAGIRLEPAAKVSLLGVPFVISTPYLLPLGLILISCYGLLRFYYYGFMLSTSPYRNRADLLRRLHPEGGYGSYQGPSFFGPTKFSTVTLTTDSSEVETQISQLLDAFPKVGRKKPTGTLNAHRDLDEEGEEYVSWGADFTIPTTCRLAAILQDIDYAAPVWMNLLALGTAFTRMFG